MTMLRIAPLLLAWCFFQAVCIARERPNVVVLFTDDQGTLDAGCYGSKHLITPHIDRLAADGMRFTQAYAHTVCCPARAALLTGRHPQRSGINNWTQGNMHGPKGINLALDEVTLAEVLRDAGYRSALFGKWHLGAHEDHGPLKQGFQEFFGIRGGFIDNYNHHFLHGTGFHDLFEGAEMVAADGQYFPEMMVRRSLEFIEQNRERPFFLYAAFNLPHYPEQALEKFRRLYSGVADERLRSYGAVISTTDHYIGLILDQLDRFDLSNNTIVIFMSDNGHSEETFMRIQVKSTAAACRRTVSMPQAGRETPENGLATRRLFWRVASACPPFCASRARCPPDLLETRSSP